MLLGVMDMKFIAKVFDCYPWNGATIEFWPFSAGCASPDDFYKLPKRDRLRRHFPANIFSNSAMSLIVSSSNLRKRSNVTAGLS